MKIAALIIGVVALVPQAALAQTPAPITGSEWQVYRASDPTTGAPFRTLSVALNAMTCNLPPTSPPTTTLINPQNLEVDDPGNAGKACRMAVGAFVAALPAATGYRSTLTYLSAVGPSPRSNVTTPFDVPQVPPAAPTGLGVRP